MVREIVHQCQWYPDFPDGRRYGGKNPTSQLYHCTDSHYHRCRDLAVWVHGCFRICQGLHNWRSANAARLLFERIRYAERFYLKYFVALASWSRSRRVRHLINDHPFAI